MKKDYDFWRAQIASAKTAARSYWSDADKCAREYCEKNKYYNIFYSNVSILDATLNLANPRPDIQRRFLKNMEADKKKSVLYATVAKILNCGVECVSDLSEVNEVMKNDVHNANVTGSGIAWISYEPKIYTDKMGVQHIASQDIKCDYLKYNEYLCSSAEKEQDIWWVARRHLLTRNDIYERFGYSADDTELSYKPDDSDETAQKRAEVWEIWDKADKHRIFIMLGHTQKDLLEDTEDPYTLDSFFPCDCLTFVTEENSVVPVAEYMLYEKQADSLEKVCKKISDNQKSVKYVGVIGSQDKSIAQDITRAKDGEVLSIPVISDVQGNVNNMVGSLPIDPVVNLLGTLEAQKAQTIQNIYELTGISDIMRGATDPRETAKAQQIKGVFGSLRFQDRQKQVQNHRRNIYRIIAEIIAEHYDINTIYEMTGIILPRQEQKAQIEMQVKALQAQQVQIPPALQEQYKLMEENPTWEEVLEVLRSDKLRNYTVEIETTATAFDNKEELTEAINNLTNTYVNMCQLAATLNSPELIKGFIPVIKMNLSNCRVSSSIARQLEEAIDGAYREMNDKLNAPQPPTPEQMKINADMQLQQAKLNSDSQLEMKRLEVELAKINGEHQYKQEEIAIKKQEADRKDRELDAQIFLEQEKLNTNGGEINVKGDVRDLA